MCIDRPARDELLCTVPDDQPLGVSFHLADAQFLV